MSYLDDLKKKGQQFVQNVQNAANTAKNVYNAAQQGVQNVYNAATGNTQQKPQTQAPNTQPSPAAQPQNAQPAQAQPEVDWAAEYDKAMTPQTTPTTGSQPGGQAAQPPTSAAAQSALGEGAGQWQAELDNVMAQIMGKGKFEYDMNGDAMYQQYADIYQNQANLGMQNAMAQAAALTGGYGSSYAQQVGQQAYAQQMQGLNEIGLDLYDRAYAQDQAERSQLMDQYNMLAAREEQAYNRAYQEGRDKVADDQWNKQFNWQAEEFDKLYGDEGFYATESQKDREHQTSESKLNREHDASESKLDREHQTSENKLNREHDSAESKLNREHQTSENKLNREHDSAENKLNREHDSSENQLNRQHDENMQEDEQNWQAEEWDKMYGENGYMTNKNKQDQENWQKEFDREGELIDKAEEAAKPTTKYEGEGALNGQEVPKVLAGTQGLTTTNTNFFDDNGTFKSAAVVTENDDGTMTYNVGGKEVTVQMGVSPYTNRANPDVKKGVMANGYQPDNYANQKVGEPLEGLYTTINGVEVDIYSVKKDGKDVKIAYDEANNKYIELDSEEIEEGEPDNKQPTSTVGGAAGLKGSLTQHLKQ